MGCTNAKAAGAEDGGPGGLRSSTSAIKGGVQSQEVKERKLSIAFTSQELNIAPEGGEAAPTERASAQFEPRRIGTHTLHGVMPGPKKGSAKAKVNQDRGSVVWPFAGSYNEALLCIFDGHGSRGERASEFCMTRLPQVLEKSHDALLADPASALSDAFVAVDEELRHESPHRRHMEASGTTATVVYLRGTEMWVAWVGDSRAIRVQQEAPAAQPAAQASSRRASRTAAAAAVAARVCVAELTSDHKPEVTEERARIEAAGGQVEPVDREGGGALRVWKDGQVGLGMTRSIGDGALKAVGVIARPQVSHFQLRLGNSDHGDGGGGGGGGGGSAEAPRDKFVLVASDGVWEFISSQEAAEVIARSPADASKGCEELVRLASERWRENEDAHRDDISAIVAFLPFLEEDENGGQAGGYRPTPSAGGYGSAISAGDVTLLSTSPHKKAAPPQHESSPMMFMNAGAVGIEPMASAEHLMIAAEPGQEQPADKAPDNFFSRRGSVANPYVDHAGNQQNFEAPGSGTL